MVLSLLLVVVTGVVAATSVPEDLPIQDLLLRIGGIADAASESREHAIDIVASPTTASSASTSTTEECFATTLDACFAETECLVCAASAPDYCADIDVVDCESYWDMLCCTHGTSDTCLENALLFDLVGAAFTLFRYMRFLVI